MYGIEVAQAGMREGCMSIWTGGSLDRPRAYTRYDFSTLSIQQT
jgi:hypothetical protein